MTGLGSDALPTVKYINEGVDTCDRGTIVNAVFNAIGSPKPDRVVIVSNTRSPKCPGVSDGNLGGDTVVVYNLKYFTPNVMFHELGHTLSLNHPATSLCYSNGKQVMMSNNCTTVDHENFQNMGVISYDQAMFKSDGVTAANPGAKGIMEYSAYNRLSTLWPMLKESNVLDFTGSGTYTIYNSETASIGNKAAVVRIPLSSLAKIDRSLVDGKVNYHTHYYIDFSQRRPNTAAGGLYNYVVVRSGPDHRAKRAMDTRFMTAMSKDDSSYGSSFYDGQRKIRVTLTSMTSTSATFDITVPSGYTPTSNVNNCYFSSAIDTKYVVTSNGNKVCRALAYNNIPLVGSFNGTACLTNYASRGYVTAPPAVEYLHCTATPKWITLSNSVVANGFDLWGKDDNFVCSTTYQGVQYTGRGSQTQCCFYLNGWEKCVAKADGPSTTYLKWLTV
ncbi:hypothetical protein IWW50_004369 [Coemansia erecta]|nr:hypothetical protein IWW50_004369 [Coemansia erecta]